jgi:YggT family protein
MGNIHAPDARQCETGQAKRGGKHCTFRARRVPLPQPIVLRSANMTSLFQILLMIVDIAKWIVLAHVIMSWLINFQVLNLRQPLVAQLWSGLNRILEPIYARVRRFVPTTAGLDFAPLIVLVAIYALRIVLVNNIASFY